jgi:hypothetical protein
MKNRFNFNDEDNFPDDLFPSYGGGDDAEEYGEDPGYDPYSEDRDRESDEIAQAIELERRDLNQKILFNTITALEKSWLWRFRSEKVKREMIRKAFLENQRLVSQGEFQIIDYTKED